jgi:hypothetical protein
MRRSVRNDSLSYMGEQNESQMGAVVQHSRGATRIAQNQFMMERLTHHGIILTIHVL